METPKPRTYELYNHMANEHGLTLLDSELNEIEIIVDRMLAADREHETAHGSSSELGAVSWLDAAEVKAALLSTLPYYECDDKDSYHYLATYKDIERAVEAIVAAGRAKASNQQLDGKTD